MTLDLSSVLPHDHPMIMVDKLVSSDNKSAVIEVTIKDNYPFTNGKIGTWIGLEFMAQSAAVLAKISNLDDGEEPRLGFLVGTRKFIANLPEFIPRQKVLISVNLDSSEITSPMVNVSGVIKDTSGVVICEASLTLYRPKDNFLYSQDEA
jgi:predicted hotdog family 3-hydroxylacyl-ACP dehydratase